MPASTKAPEAYSTNPNTIKARRRKMNLTGSKKVEDAARTADYKAMLYARKTVQQKPSYARASDSEKSTMLEEAMRDTMEKRRARGQDTMSKMVAFRAGTYRDRDSTTGPQTRVPISAFLKNNGFVPSRPMMVPQRGVTESPSNLNLANQGTCTPMSLGTAPVTDGVHMGNAFADAYGPTTSANGQSGPSPLKWSPRSRCGSAPAQHHLRSDTTLLESQSGPPPPLSGVKACVTPDLFPNMSPDPMRSSIEGDTATADPNGSLGRLQIEMGHLRTICQHVMASNNNIREFDLRKVQAEMGIETNHMRELEARVKKLEGVVHALQNTSLGNIVDRVNELERIFEDLKSKVGSGCDAEIAKMREVMGTLKSALDKVGGFV